MNSVKSYGTSAQRVFALIVMLASGFGATQIARAEPVQRGASSIPGADSSILEVLWDQSMRIWFEMLRQRLIRPIPAAGSSIQSLMIGTIDCYNEGGFPTFEPGEAPVAYLEVLKNLHDLSLTAPSSVDPDLAEEFRAVLVAAGA